MNSLNNYVQEGRARATTIGSSSAQRPSLVLQGFLISWLPSIPPCRGGGPEILIFSVGFVSSLGTLFPLGIEC